MRNYIIALLLVASAVTACKTKEQKAMIDSKQADVLVEKIYESTTSNVKKKQINKIATRLEAQKLLANYIGDDEVARLLKGIDFNEESLIVAYAGEYNTGGYGITFKEDYPESKTHKLIFEITPPDNDTPVTMAFTTPVAVFRIKKPASELSTSWFIDRI